MSNGRSTLGPAHLFVALLMLTATPGHVPARCVKPSGRSLEPRSDARPRGMAVQSRLAGADRIRLTGPAANKFLKFIFEERPMSAPSRRPEIRRRRTRKEKILQLRKRLAAAKTDADTTRTPAKLQKLAIMSPGQPLVK